jgi:hypothetical protein
MRELRTTEQVLGSGASASRIKWALQTGRWTLIIRGVYGRGPKLPSKLDIARATALVTNGVSHALVAGELHAFDNVRCDEPEVWVPRSANAERKGVRRKIKMPNETVELHQVRCTTAADTLLELARRLDDIAWEQALEFCLRKEYVTAELVGLHIPHTDSLLETLAVQLFRSDPALPVPTRQLRIFDPVGQRFVARVDLCWPHLGIFLELDGQQHKDQPVYDAVRQNKVTKSTRWLCVRLTWDQVNKWPEATLRDFRELLLPNCLVP